MAPQSPRSCAGKQTSSSDWLLNLHRVQKQEFRHYMWRFFSPDVTLLSLAKAKPQYFSWSGGRCVKTQVTYRAASGLLLNVILVLPSPPTDTFPLVTSGLMSL